MKISRGLEERARALEVLRDELISRYDTLIWDMAEYITDLESTIDDYEQGDEAAKEVTEFDAKNRRDNGFPTY
jgi:two-component sensor histidine kinase